MKLKIDRKTIAYSTWFNSFISIGAAFILLISVFLWGSYNSLRDFVISSNNEKIQSMMIYLEHSIQIYSDELQSEARNSTFTKAVMNSENAEYYLPDYMNKINLHNLKGNYILTTFDGMVIHSTSAAYPSFQKSPVLNSLMIEGKHITMMGETDVVFISPVLYQGLTEGYLIFISSFYEIYKSNSFFLNENLHDSSVSVFHDGKAIIKNDSQEESFSSSYSLETLPLEIVISTPLSLVQETVKGQITRILIISLISIFLMTMFLTVLITRKISVPLKQFEEGIKKVSSGMWEEVQVDEKAPVEIVFLSQSFNNMQKSIQKKTGELEGLNQELRLAMEELENTHLRMLQSEKMASIGLLAAGVAHEINNPTGYINTNLIMMSEYMDTFNKVFKSLDALMKQAELNSLEGIKKIIEEINEIREEEDLPFLMEDGVKLLEESTDGTRRIKDIVHRLSTYAYADNKGFEAGDVNTAIENALKLTVNELKYNCTIIKDMETLPSIQCRLDQLTQVFINLFVNSSHAMEGHGTINIESRFRNDNIYIKVTDSGKGIPQENISRLFDPFFTTKEVGKGTGLGLSITKGIIENHSGTISVESKLGIETSFLIQLPVHQNNREKGE